MTLHSAQALSKHDRDLSVCAQSWMEAVLKELSPWKTQAQVTLGSVLSHGVWSVQSSDSISVSGCKIPCRHAHSHRSDLIVVIYLTSLQFLFSPWQVFVSKLWQSLNESFQSVQLPVCCLIWRLSGRLTRFSFPLWRLGALEPTLLQSLRQLIVLVFINCQLIPCPLCMTCSSTSHCSYAAGPSPLLESSR